QSMASGTFVSRLLRVRKALRVPASALYRRALLRCGVLPGVEHESLLRALDCKTIADVGANRGQFALAAREALPNARIISFEPLGQPAAVFRRVFASDDRVVLHQCAIGTEPGESTIYLAEGDDSSSLLPITRLQQETFPNSRFVGTDLVHTDRLDHILR